MKNTTRSHPRSSFGSAPRQFSRRGSDYFFHLLGQTDKPHPRRQCSYDVTFGLFSASIGAGQIGATLTNASTAILK